MKKALLFGMFILVAASLMAAAPVKEINGVKLYQTGNFPYGKLLSLDGLTSLPNGTWQEPVYFAEPIEFKDNGVPDGNGCYTYMAKVHHTWVGGLFVKLTDSAASSALFKIKIPYKAPLSSGTIHKFTTSAPLTIVSKENRLDSNGNSFGMYNCVCNGYLTVNGTAYPNGD